MLTLHWLLQRWTCHLLSPMEALQWLPQSWLRTPHAIAINRIWPPTLLHEFFNCNLQFPPRIYIPALRHFHLLKIFLAFLVFSLVCLNLFNSPRHDNSKLCAPITTTNKVRLGILLKNNITGKAGRVPLSLKQCVPLHITINIKWDRRLAQ